jgi:hypothetical protein
LFVLYTIAAVIASVLIESFRITISYGKVQNVSKLTTITLGAILFAVCVALIYTDYYYTPSPIEVGLYALFYISVRGVFYDPLLNLWTDKELDYVSTKTNSVIDWIERVGLKWGFWTERLVYLLLAILTGLLYATIYA